MTKVILFNFGKLGEEKHVKELIDLLDEKLKEIDVSVLVNNVGYGTSAVIDKVTLFEC